MGRCGGGHWPLGMGAAEEEREEWTELAFKGAKSKHIEPYTATQHMHIDYVVTYSHKTLGRLSIYLNTDNTWKAIGSWDCLDDAGNANTNSFVCLNGFLVSDSVHCNSLKSSVCI